MAHIHELIDFTSEVFVVYKNRVLLRKHDKYGIWLSVGGHIELNEDPNQAAIREVKEEVGLDITLDDTLLPKTYSTDDYKELVPPYFLNIHSITPTHKHISLVYFAKSKTDKIVQTIKREKSMDIIWFTKKELENTKEEINPNVKYYALKAIEKLSN